MTGTIKLPQEDVFALACGDSVDGWSVLSHEIVDEWRWGNVYRLVIQKAGVPGTWAYDYREQSGDESYSSIDDEPDEIEFYRVVPRAKWVIEYVRPKEGE